MGRLAKIVYRVYNDYLMPSRLDEYERVIVALKRAGYEHITLRDYNQKLKSKTLGNRRYFINRHDIDTDIKTTRAFFEIEKKHGVKATYYFRLCTFDFNLMEEINRYGSEASYHFEEVAQYCKDNHIKSRQKAFEEMEKIKELFKSNFRAIEEGSGAKIRTLCSHGDFVNRELNIINNEITKDKKLRQELGIECEAYDSDIMDSFDIYVADDIYPIEYKPDSIFSYIGKRRVICMLTHPRPWRSSIMENTIDNFKRLYEGIRW